MFILDDVVEGSALFNDERDAIEDVSRIAYLFLETYLESARDTKKLKDDECLENFLSSTSTDILLKNNNAISSLDNARSATKLLNEYLRLSNVELHGLSFDGSKDRYFVASLILYDREWKTKKGHARKNEAKSDISSQILNHIAERNDVVSGGVLTYSHKDFDEQLQYE